MSGLIDIVDIVNVQDEVSVTSRVYVHSEKTSLDV